MDDSQKRFPKDYDVGIRLQGSYVMYGNNPLYCYESTLHDDFYPAVSCKMGFMKDNGEVSFTAKIINPNDPLFDTRPVHIGWTSTYTPSAGTVYVMRKPQRSQRAGLHNNNCLVFDPTTKKQTSPTIFGNQKIMFASMMNLYTSDLKEAVKILVDGKKNSVSLSHKFAIQPVKSKSGSEEEKKREFGILYCKYFSTGILNFKTNTFYQQKNLDPKIELNVKNFLNEHGVKHEYS